MAKRPSTYSYTSHEDEFKLHHGPPLRKCSVCGTALEPETWVRDNESVCPYQQEHEIADFQRQLQQAQEERDALRRRYTGNREECGHLRRFICGQGTMVEHCAVCKAEAAEALAEGLEAERQAMQDVAKPSPAEALRAEHRSDRDRTPSTESPQSGQARQEER